MSCFTAGTEVRMADGRVRNIEDIYPGDRVLGMDGKVNTVEFVERVPLGDRLLYGFNGGRPFVTSEHPFFSLHGWKSLSPERTYAENPNLKLNGTLSVGDVLLREGGTEVLREMNSVEATGTTVLYNLILNADGNRTYFVNGYLVHNKEGRGGGVGG